MVRRSVPRRAWLALIPLVVGCGANHRQNAATTHPTKSIDRIEAAHASQPAPAPLPVTDPVLDLIAASEHHFEAGQSELGLGHFEAAKREFDKAVSILMESPYGGRTEPRIREHFDRLVDRISAYEVRALAEGDGFTEKQYEPASIDELLAMSATLAPPTATEETKDTVQGDPVEHDVPIPLNQRVLAFIELFQGRLHDFIEEGMKRGSKYLPMIQSVFRAEGLPLDLAYIPLVESAFKPNALSRAQAKGVWQFMRGTATENGLRQDWYIDERSDPEKATIAAAKYLGMLARMFDGDWHLALASYNGGPGRVQRAMKRGGLGDFWALAAKPNLLPRETRDYVPMILAAIVVARNPAQYGFDFETAAPMSYEKVTLPRPIDLRRVAEWTETPVDDIRALNPELRRWTTPVRDKDYELRVPEGTADIVAAQAAGGHLSRPGVAQVVHGQAWRNADHDCTQPAGQPQRSRRSQLHQCHHQGGSRSAADGAARSDDAHGRSRRTGSAGGQLAAGRARCGRRRQRAERRPREADLPRERGRHADINCAPVQNHGRCAPDLESEFRAIVSWRVHS